MSAAWAFSGDTALVTGAASGIGKATATALHAAGLRVLLLDQDAAAAAEVRAQLGERASAGQADIADPARTERAIADLTAGHALSYVAHCAGIHQSAGFTDLSGADWSRMLGVNLVGAFNVARACAGLLRSAPGSAIVNITSVEASRVVALANPHATPHYAAAKAGLEMLTRSLAHELAPDGIRVNAVAPGLVDTPMTRSDHGSDSGGPPGGAGRELARAFADHLLIKRYAQPGEIAAAICFLLSDSASYITATTLTVDGGFTAL
ncbi:MAG: SDR family NAD(P)-dependent oxidoreductase [Streptosporangiaceae bacterium]